MPRVFKQFAVGILAAAAVSAALSGCSGSKANGAGGKDVAATVNGKNITLSEVDRIISQQTGGQQSKMMPLELATARLQALAGLVEQEILFQRADKEKQLPSDDEITQAINGKKREANLTEEEYQKMLKESGQTEQELRETARKQLAIRKLLEKTVSNVTVNDGEVDAFYNANQERFVSPRGVALAMIAADPFDSAGQYPDDAKSDLEAKTKIDNVYAQLRGGADFATVARQRSEDPSFVRGGDFSFWDEAKLKGSGLPQEVISNLFGAMRPGDITPPFHMEDGRWIILKLTDRRLQNEPQTLATPGVRDQIKQALINERQRVLGEALRVVAMNEAKVENYLAQDMIKNPSTLGGNQPASPNAAASPAAGATPGASATPAATA
ncbi:MAG TPA: SurA N-terminal domain-containing protein, partial [Pyrinomonadaceae bacterium]|nr:SurA N-terminal domain-containing protein [Pyrinomonadaceae bacterium]